jgi:curved DNA-binding protein CbpA
MSRPADFYEILALPHDCSREQIRDAYLVLARKYHPDVAADKTDAHSHFIEVGKAYHTLYDPKAREEYDRKQHSAQQLSPVPVVVTPQAEPFDQPPRDERIGTAPTYGREAARPADYDDRFNQPGWNWKAGTTRAGTLPPRPASRPARPLDRPSVPPPTKPVASPVQSADGAAVDLLRQARAELRRNQWSSAERLCLNYLALDPQSAEGLETLGDIHATSGRKADAIRCYRGALKVLPGNEIVEAKIDCLRCTELFPDPDAPPRPPTPSHQTEHEPPKHTGWGRFGIANWLSDRFR